MPIHDQSGRSNQGIIARLLLLAVAVWSGQAASCWSQTPVSAASSPRLAARSLSADDIDHIDHIDHATSDDGRSDEATPSARSGPSAPSAPQLPSLDPPGPSPSDTLRDYSKNEASEPPERNEGQAAGDVDDGDVDDGDVDDGDEVVGDEVVEAQNEIWQINTRHLPARCRNPKFRVHKLSGGRWQSRSLEDLVSPFDGIVVVYAHGNRMAPRNTLDRGILYYRSLTRCAGAPRIRFVIWSWPSGKIKGQLRDVRLKADRADCEGAYLAGVLNLLTPEQTTSLIGYSYGARVVASCLALQARGGTAQMPLRVARPTRVVMNAAAFSNCDLSGRGRYRGAMSLTDRMLMLYNSTDPILKRYHVVVRHAKPDALGYTGLTCAIPGGAKIRQIDASPVVGRSHYEPRYLGNRGLAHEMRRCLLWQEMP